MPLGEKVGGEDGVGDGLDLGEGWHEGWHVGVVGSEHELGARDAVAEETFDLVVEHGAGAVVEDSRKGGFSVLIRSGEGGWKRCLWFGEGFGRGGKEEEKKEYDIPRIEDFLRVHFQWWWTRFQESVLNAGPCVSFVRELVVDVGKVLKG